MKRTIALALIAVSLGAVNLAPAQINPSARMALEHISKFGPISPEPHMSPGRTHSVPVKLRVVVGRDGSVENIKYLEGHPLVISRAIDAVRQWKFRPFREGGKKIGATFDIVVLVKNTTPTTLDEIKAVNRY